MHLLCVVFNECIFLSFIYLCTVPILQFLANGVKSSAQSHFVWSYSLIHKAELFSGNHTIMVLWSQPLPLIKTSKVFKNIFNKISAWGHYKLFVMLVNGLIAVTLFTCMKICMKICDKIGIHFCIKTIFILHGRQ